MIYQHKHTNLPMFLLETKIKQGGWHEYNYYFGVGCDNSIDSACQDILPDWCKYKPTWATNHPQLADYIDCCCVPVIAFDADNISALIDRWPLVQLPLRICCMAKNLSVEQCWL